MRPLTAPRWLAPALLALLGVGVGPPSCADFGPLASGVCGNAVVDVGEDCDSHGTAPGTVCAAAGMPNACRLLCGAASAHAVCPQGWGCGRDGVCREPSGRFAPLGDLVPFASPHGVRVADFDGDGLSDVLVLGEEDAVGRGPARIVFAPITAAAARVLVLPTDLAAPVAGRFEVSSSASDLAFADLDGVSMFRGAHDPQSSFVAFPSLLPSTGTFLRVVPMDVIPAEPGDEIVAFFDRQEQGTTLERPAGKLPAAVLTPLPGGEAALAGEIAWGQLDEAAPCAQIVFPYRGSGEVLLFTPCRVHGAGVEWNVGGALAQVALPAGALVDRGVVLVDLDHDQHLDLLIGASGHTFVAWGLGDGTFTSAHGNGQLGAAGPYALPEAAGGATAFPLAAGDLDGDGVADFVVPAGVVVSTPKGYVVAQANTGSPWTQAVIADLDADGRLDVAAGTRDAVDLDLFINAGGGVYNPSVVPTDGRTSHLVAGDFDGDLVTDLAFVQSLDHGAGPRDYATIAFGVAKGHPVAPVIVAELHAVEQMVPARFSSVTGPDAIMDFVAVSRGLSGTDALFAFQGSGSRSPRAPLPLGGATAPALAVALTAGVYGNASVDLAAVGADRDTGDLRFWRIEGTEELTLEHLLPSAALAPQFHSVAVDRAVSFRYGACLAAGDLTGDGTAEVVLVAAYGLAADGAALVIADYDAATFTFTPRPEQPFAGVLSVDSTFRLVDLDGDGHLDGVLRTGSDEKPGDLLVFWGDGNGGLDTAAPGRIQLPGGALDLACLPPPGGAGCDLVVLSAAGASRVVFTRDRGLALTPLADLAGGRGIGAGDFDGDGLVDLALQTQGGLQFYRSVPVRE